MIIKRKCTLVSLSWGLSHANIHCDYFTYEVHKGEHGRLPVLYLYKDTGEYVASVFDVKPSHVSYRHGFYTFKGRNFSGLA